MGHRYQLQLQYLRKAISEGGDGPEYHYHLGMILAARQKEAEAVAALGRSLAPGVEYEGIEVAKETLQRLSSALSVGT